MGRIQEFCVNAPKLQNRRFFLKIHLSLQKGYNHTCSASPTKKVTSRGRGARVKNKIQGAGPFLTEYLRMIFKGWPHRKKIASPGQSSTDRTWWDKLKNFVSTRAQIAKRMFFAENTVVLAKGYRHTCSASPTKKVTWRGWGAGVKNKIQGAGPFFDRILVDDLQRLAPQEKNRITRPIIHW